MSYKVLFSKLAEKEVKNIIINLKEFTQDLNLIQQRQAEIRNAVFSLDIFPERYPIYKTNNDPLAKIMRKLCKDNRIKKLDVVTSYELSIKTHDRTPGSTPFVPSVAGLYMANFIVNKWLKEIN